MEYPAIYLAFSLYPTMLLRSLLFFSSLLAASALQLKGKVSVTSKDDTVKSYAWVLPT